MNDPLFERARAALDDAARLLQREPTLAVRARPQTLAEIVARHDAVAGRWLDASRELVRRAARLRELAMHYEISTTALRDCVHDAWRRRAHDRRDRSAPLT